MGDVGEWFDEALAIPDPIERSEALCDLAFDAEQMVLTGNRDDAIELFELLSTLDRFDDLLHPAIESADRHLISLGMRKQDSLDEIVEKLRRRFEHLGEHQRLIAVAKALVREHCSSRPEVWQVALNLLAAAEHLQPLGLKDARFRAEVSQKVK